MKPDWTVQMLIYHEECEREGSRVNPFDSQIGLGVT